MYISDEAVIKMERTRAKLEQKLKDRGVLVEDGEDMNSLVAKVEKIGQNDLLYDFINGNLTEFRLLNEKMKTISSVAPFASIATTVTKLYLPYIENIKVTFGTNRGPQLLHLYIPNLKSTNASYGLAYMAKLVNIIAPEFSQSANNGYGVITGDSSLVRFIVPKYNHITERLSGEALAALTTIDAKRCTIQGSLSSLETLILRHTSLTTQLGSASHIPEDVNIYVPNSMIDTYKSATNWTARADNIIALEGSPYESEEWYKTEDWYLEEMAVWK